MTVAVVNRFKSLKAVTGTLTPSSTNIYYTSTISLIFTMNSSHATGSVIFYADGVSFRTAAVTNGNTATAITGVLAVGTHSLSATYNGNAEYSTSVSNSNNVTITVNGIVPNAPTNLTAVINGTNGANIYWSDSTFNGGVAILSYTITSVPAAVSHTVTGTGILFYSFANLWFSCFIFARQ